MKPLPKILLTLTAVAITSLFCARPAQAYTVTLHQVEANVVATGSGAINLTGLTLFITSTPQAEVFAQVALITTGQSSVDVPTYIGSSGPTSFGSGMGFLPNTSSGDFVGIQGHIGHLFVPAGYVSNHTPSDSMTFTGATFASLGVTPGAYTWTWGTGLANQNFTLQIGPATVPDSGSTVFLLGCALLGLAALRRKLSC